MPNQTILGALDGRWWKGRNLPRNDLGADGDMYMRLTDCTVYVKLDDVWVQFEWNTCTCTGGLLTSATAAGRATVLGVGAATSGHVGTAHGTSTASGVSNASATHYVITTDGNQYNTASGTFAQLPGYPLDFDVVFSLNGPGSNSWGTPGWSLVPFDGVSTPTNSIIVNETGRDLASLTLHVTATNFADLYGWSIAFDGTQTVDGFPPAFLGEIASSFTNLYPGLTQANITPEPATYDPIAPSMTVFPSLLTYNQFLPTTEAGLAVVTVSSIIIDGGTAATTPTIAAVSADPADGWFVTFDGGSDYTGYSYGYDFIINGVLNAFGTLTLKDLNI